MTRSQYRQWVRESIAQAIERISEEEFPLWTGYVYVAPDLICPKCSR